MSLKPHYLICCYLFVLASENCLAHLPTCSGLESWTFSCRIRSRRRCTATWQSLQEAPLSIAFAELWHQLVARQFLVLVANQCNKFWPLQYPDKGSILSLKPKLGLCPEMQQPTASRGAGSNHSSNHYGFQLGWGGRLAAMSQKLSHWRAR